MVALFKYFTPALITLLSLIISFLILLLIVFSLLIIFRRTTVSKKIIWNIREIRNLFSNVPSYYSMKRINSFSGFYSGLFVMLCYDWLHRHDINATEIGIHVGILATLSYQITKQIQQEKKDSLMTGSLTSTSTITSSSTSSNIADVVEENKP